MAKAKKGPRQIAGLQCSVCNSFNYVTEYNKNNELLMKQTKNVSTFPLNKYCNVCHKHSEHKMAKKLK